MVPFSHILPPGLNSLKLSYRICLYIQTSQQMKNTNKAISFNKWTNKINLEDRYKKTKERNLRCGGHMFPLRPVLLRVLHSIPYMYIFCLYFGNHNPRVYGNLIGPAKEILNVKILWQQLNPFFHHNNISALFKG